MKTCQWTHRGNVWMLKTRISFHTFFVLYGWMSQGFVTLTFFFLLNYANSQPHIRHPWPAAAGGHVGRCCRLCQASSTLRFMAGQMSRDKALSPPLALCCCNVYKPRRATSHSEAPVGDLLSLFLVLSDLLFISPSLSLRKGIQM